MQVPDEWYNKFATKTLDSLHRDTSREHEGMTRSALAMVENIDWNVGRVVQKLQELDSRHEELSSIRHTRQDELDRARTRWRDARETRHQVALTLENFSSTKRSLEGQVTRNSQQHDELVARCSRRSAARN